MMTDSETTEATETADAAETAASEPAAQPGVAPAASW